MKYRVLMVIPPIFGLIHLVCYFLYSEAPWYPNFVNIEIVVVKSLSFLGFMVAARSFNQGEYLRRGWLLLAGSIFLFNINDIVFRLLFPGIASDILPLLIQSFLLVLGNLFFIVGVWILARTWHSAGLNFAGTKWKKRLVVFGAIALVLGLVAPSVLENVLRLFEEQVTQDNVLNIISGISDTIALSLIAPMFMTTRSLQGGLIRWPWIFLTLTLFSWLGFDAMFSWGPIAGLSAGAIRCCYEFFRINACMFGMSAGLAQHFVKQEIHSNNINIQNPA